MNRTWLKQKARSLSAALLIGLSSLAWFLGSPLSLSAAPNAAIDLHVHILNPPNAVADLAAAPVGSQTGDVQLTWHAPSNANGVGMDHYLIRFATFPAPNIGTAETWWTNAAASEITMSPAHAAGVQEFTTVHNLTTGVTFYFGIKVIDRDNQISSIDSRTGTASQAASMPLDLGGSPPTTPTGFTGVALSSTSIQWSWNPVAGAGFYTLNSFPSGSLVVQSTSTSVIETSLTPNMPLARTLKAGNGSGLSGPTSVQTVYTEAAIPANLVVSNVTFNSISLGWGSGGNPAGTQYNIERSNDGTNFASLGLTTNSNYTDSGLGQLTLYYYRISALNGNSLPSATTPVISTVTLQQTDTLAPQVPMGLKGAVDPTGNAFALTWDPVSTNEDNTPITDLAGYNVYRRTDLSASPLLMTPSPLSVRAFADNVSGQVYYYTVRAVDTTGNRSTESLYADSSSDANVIYIGPDTVSSVVMPESVNNLLRSNYNKYGVPLTIQMTEHAVPPNSAILREIQLYLVRGDNQQAVSDLAFGAPQVTINIGVNVQAGEIAPGAPASNTGLHSLVAASKVAIFWNNGVTWIKVGGKVNLAAQTISIKSSYMGAYQVRATGAATALNLEQGNVFPRLFTPNGDGFNDKVYFVLENPNDASVTGRIFDLSGRLVATLPPPSTVSGIGNGTLIWDGKDAKGSVVPSGAYYYKIEGEGQTFTGTVGVAR